MSQIPILSGIYTDEHSELRSSYPINLVPVPKDSGISQGYLRPADGIIQNGAGPGIGRGGINWNGRCYRVMGSNLVGVGPTGNTALLGTVTLGGQVSMTYSFDLLAIASGGALYYWDGVQLAQVTDPDLGTVVDVVWVDGYFMTTDGKNLIVTELTNPFAVNPLKYGSSEADPDPIMALKKLRNEIFAVNRYTIEVFDNVGGALFPFQRVTGAQIQKGAIGTHACCIYMEAVAFVGGGRNEPPGVYVGVNATATKISTQEVDTILATFTEDQLAQVLLEARIDRNNHYLLVHLPDRTLIFDGVVGEAAGGPVWFTHVTAVSGFSQYRARNFVWCYNQWLVDDPQSSAIGYMTQDLGSHWGAKVYWEFGTIIVYNSGNGVIFTELELVCLPGRMALGDKPIVSTSYTLDGETWSQERRIGVSTRGDRNARLVWRKQGLTQNWRIQRFRGDSTARLSFIRLEVQLELLAV